MLRKVMMSTMNLSSFLWLKLIIGVVLITVLVSCNKGEWVAPVRANFIMLKTSEADTVLQRISTLAEQNGLSNNHITIGPIEDSLKHYRSGDEKTIAVIYSDRSSSSDIDLVLSIKNTRTYCGLDLFLTVIDENHAFLSVYDAFIKSLENDYIVELIDVSVDGSYNEVIDFSKHRSSVRLGVAENSNECT